MLSVLYAFFFFSTLGPPLKCTLFPYTTLFRSQRHAQVVDRARERGQVVDDVDRLVDPDVLDDVVVDEDEVVVDRKSTRLNSSHANTPYAVFCLKKTTKTNWVRRYRHAARDADL